MKTISLETTNGRCIAAQVRIADSFVARTLGLLRDRSIDEQQGLLLTPCGSVHTFGLRFAIDVVFLDRRMRVLGVAPHVPPQRFCLAPPHTARVLELAPGRIAAVGLLIGAYVFVSHESRDASDEAAIGPSHPRPPARCVRPPIQFSLRLPPQRCAQVQSNLALSRTRAPARVQALEKQCRNESSELRRSCRQCSDGLTGKRPSHDGRCVVAQEQ